MTSPRRERVVATLAMKKATGIAMTRSMTVTAIAAPIVRTATSL